jgi:hypothetical protein
MISGASAAARVITGTGTAPQFLRICTYPLPELVPDVDGRVY